MATIYLDSPGAILHRRGSSVELRVPGKAVRKMPLNDVDCVVVSSWAKITSPLMVQLLDKGISVHYVHPGGRYVGGMSPARSGGFQLKAAQYAGLEDEERQLEMIRGIVAGKLLNQRQILRRAFYRGRDSAGKLREGSRQLGLLSKKCGLASSVDFLRGLEGQGAAVYFDCWPLLLRSPWRFSGRNRRPPRDPVNAMLSFGYALLTGLVQSVVVPLGLDPLVGYLHPPFRGRSALVLDLMEEFRPSVVDRAVLALCNRGDLQQGWFVSQGGGVAMSPEARRRLIQSFEVRLDTVVTDRGTGRSASLRRHVEFQVRQWGRALKQDESYLPLVLE